MAKEKLESHLVNRLMQGATEAEIEEATRRWFGFLNTLFEIVLERNQQLQRGSQDPRKDDRFKNAQKTI